MPTGKDIDHLKLLSIHEQPLDNRQKYLDVLCFPSLFPTGKYGEFHPHTVKLTFSEYLKLKLMNCDSRFRKNPEFVFYYLLFIQYVDISACALCYWVHNKGRKESHAGIMNCRKISVNKNHCTRNYGALE